MSWLVFCNCDDQLSLEQSMNIESLVPRPYRTLQGGWSLPWMPTEKLLYGITLTAAPVSSLNSVFWPFNLTSSIHLLVSTELTSPRKAKSFIPCFSGNWVISLIVPADQHCYVKCPFFVAFTAFCFTCRALFPIMSLYVSTHHWFTFFIHFDGSLLFWPFHILLWQFWFWALCMNIPCYLHLI